MNKHLEISIPKSCTENWASMSQVAGGSYCSSCQKKVTDFTDFNKKEIQEWFELHQNEKICGRFLRSQLVGQSEYSTKVGVWAILRTKILAASVLIFPFTLKASSNSLTQKQATEVAPVSERTPHSQVSEKQTLPADSIKTIKGIVLDKATKEILPGAVVMIKGTTIKSFSDDKGNFQINWSKDISPVLVISCLGYQTFEQEVRNASDKPITIMLTEDMSAVLGEICIVKKPSLLQRIIRPFKKKL